MICLQRLSGLFFKMQQFVVLAVLSLAACGSATVGVQSLVDYHERIAIPLATRIKAAEEAILADGNPAARIVGGNFAEPNSHPYLGGLIVTYVNNPYTGVCGSALVSLTRLVTGAHCWFDGTIQANRFTVVVGSHYLFSGGQRITTDQVYTYPSWTPSTLQNNFAVIYLPQPVILSPSAQPIALPNNENENFVGYWGVATGYGVTDDNQESIPVDTVVSEVEMEVISNEQCRATFGGFVQPNHVCTDGSDGVGTCWGDGGGPLAVFKDGKRVLIGVTTFGAAAGCGRGYPSGFARVSSYLDFINHHL